MTAHLIMAEPVYLPAANHHAQPAPMTNLHDNTGGAYGWLTPYLVFIASHNADISARVLFLRREEVHLIAMCVSLMGEMRGDVDHLAAFARGLGAISHRTLIENAAHLGGVPISSGLAKLTGKLAGGVWRPVLYQQLAQLMLETSARKVLRHRPFVTRRDVMTLRRLPVAYRTPGVLKMIKRQRDLTEILFAIELVTRVRTDLDERRILASLEKTSVKEIRSWVMKHYEHAPFPTAPSGAMMIHSVEAMRPLTCYADLARAAREFENCIRTYLWAVLKGDSYFYRYAPEAGGRGVAIVELRRVPVVGWVIHEALGPDNNSIASTDRAIVLKAFREVGIFPCPQAVDPNAWFDLD